MHKLVDGSTRYYIRQRAGNAWPTRCHGREAVVVHSDVDGRPITKPINFCRFRRDINRKTEKGFTLTAVQLYSYHTGVINKKR